LSPAPDRAALCLSYRERNPETAIAAGLEESRRSPDVESTSAVGTNSELSPAPDPAVRLPPWRELNPVAAYESWSPRRADPQPEFVATLRTNSAPQSLPSLDLQPAP
jgi:hypothetical protein